MFDVFYSGTKPNLFAHEQEAKSIEHAQQLSRTRFFWWINYLSDYTGFDFLYEPVPWQAHQRHAWASQWQKDSGTYLVPRVGYTDTNYHVSPVITRLPNDANWRNPGPIDISWHPDPSEPPLIHQFGTQWQKTGGPCYVVPGATDIKYEESPRVYKTTIDPNWTTPAGADIESFDYTWHPDATDPPYIYQFGTQHQRTGGPVYTVPGATDIKFVDQLTIHTKSVAGHVYVIDHMDGNAVALAEQVSATVVRYFDNYLDTLKRIARNASQAGHEFIWVISSICDYADFDFSWHPEQWQATMLHVFASNEQKFGDTFFMHVPTFLYRSEKCQLLEWYDLNFVAAGVTRRPIPTIVHTLDSQADAIKQYTWTGPLALFVTAGSEEAKDVPTVPLWREKTKTIVPLSAGAGITVVPKIAVPYIKQQAYDYPYIDRLQRHMYVDQPLDIVFIDNGEVNADYNYEKLKSYVGKWARIHRSSGVNGRVAAYCAAAKLSTTPWFFAVFAKLEVNAMFDWAWQPDRLQQPKHYIFHARNPVNGLVYGHQAMIAYNKKLVLENTAPGLDFTLDQPHEVVPVISGTAHYDQTPWMAWRTAFREVLKLRASLPNVENEYRIKQWTADGKGVYSEWSTNGARDALEYYDEVNGNFDDLKKSYEWAWLASYAFVKHNLTPDQ